MSDLFCLVRARRGACAGGCFQATLVFQTNDAHSARWHIPSPRSLPDRSKKENRHGEQKAFAELSLRAERGLYLPPSDPSAHSRSKEPGVPLKLSSKGESCVSLPLFRLLQRLLRLRTLKALRKCERKAKNETNPRAQLREIRNLTRRKPSWLQGFRVWITCVHRCKEKAAHSAPLLHRWCCQVHQRNEISPELASAYRLNRNVHVQMLGAARLVERAQQRLTCRALSSVVFLRL